MSSHLPVYEIYAVKYAGPLVSSVAMAFWNTDWDQEIERNYYIWVVKGKDETLIVDCGMAPALAGEAQISGYVNPLEVLARMGIDGSKVKRELFREATVYIQETEFDFWINDPVSKKPPFLMLTDPVANSYLAALKGTERLIIVRGDQEILPGIELLLAPGHTSGLQAVSVNTAKGTAILGSDCGHLFRNYEEEMPSCFITDLPAWMRTYDKLKSKVSSLSLLFPGHDAKMATQFPSVAEGITRLV
jgi:glyoxylase-like metal-dependent hydrolase (beta-lactamase superfamily II)